MRVLSKIQQTQWVSCIYYCARLGSISRQISCCVFVGSTFCIRVYNLLVAYEFQYYCSIVLLYYPGDGFCIYMLPYL